MSAQTPEAPFAAADFGGTNIRSAVVTHDGEVRGWNTVETRGDLGPSSVVDRVRASVEKSIRAAGVRMTDIQAMGVAAPGPLDHEAGIVISAPNIPGFEDINVAGPLSEHLGFPVFLGNDANLAVLGEHAYGAGRGVKDMVYVTVSTGVGGGILTNGELLLGATGNAGEVGHLTVDLNGELHHCGNVGCVELYASGTGIAYYAQKAIEDGRVSALRGPWDRNNRVTGRDVVEAAGAGDDLAVEAMDQGVRALAAGLVSIIHVVNPELIVVGGGVANAGDLLFKPLREIVFGNLMPGFGDRLRIVPWTLGENVGLLGAAEWARRRLRETR